MKPLLMLCLLFPAALYAAEPEGQPGQTEFHLVISDHRFTPAEITVPADKKVRITIENRDDSFEEFDSRDLNREKVVPGKSNGVVFIGPLKPGRYQFQGEFHSSTAQGVVIAK